MRNLNILVLILFYITTNAQTIISSDTIWSNDTILISENIVVDSNVLLTINPGVNIQFDANYYIKVFGKINAIGKETDTIKFSIIDTLGFSDTSTFAGGWGGIKFLNNTIDTSVFKFCLFQYGKANEPGSTPENQNNFNLKGGAICSSFYENIHINHSVFQNNYATYSGGAIHIENSSTVIIDNCYFKNNLSKYDGGAISIWKSDSVNITNNLFYKNKAFRIIQTNLGNFAAGNGGAIFTALNNKLIIICSNKCYNNSCVSGVIYESNNKSNLLNNIVCNNKGIGLYNGQTFGNQIYTNNTISNNNNYGGSVAGIMYFNENLQLVNNILWNNLNDPSYPERLEIECPGCDNQSADSRFNVMTYGAYGEGSIDDYPQFTNPTEGAGIDYDGLSADWSLLETSPCINTGTPDTTGLNLPAFDITGNPRVFGGRIDMGAYENQSVYVKINESPVYSKINLYPNPGNNEIYIDIPPEINGSWIDIVDGQGKVLMHEQINISPAVLSPYKLKSGIYYYRIYNENQVIKSGKWVKNGR